MKLVLILSSVVLLTACSRPSANSPPGPAAAPDGARPHIPGIAAMNLAELNDWMQRCAPYASSPEARARNPYDPVDCDEIVRRQLEWRTPSTQKPATYLPGLH